MYDFANSAFTTLVVTFIYATFFTEVLAEDNVAGTTYWSWGVAISAILVALVSPFLGAVAEQGGYRKRFLFLSTVLGVVATALLYFPVPGQVAFALVLFVIANFAFEVGLVFYNAFLPDLATPERMGRVSGFAWGLGYLGGLLCLAVALVVLVMPDTPPFGLDGASGQHIRATNLLVALWYGIFSIPVFLVVKESKPETTASWSTLFADSTNQFIATFRDIRRYQSVFRLLLARIFYNDGLVTIIAFGAIYAAAEFGFETQDILIFGIVLNVAAGAGALAFGYIDDLIGGKKTLQITIVGLLLASLLAVLAQEAMWFWVSGIVVGILMGPNQSASRSLMGRFIPDGKQNEFFGFFAFSGKATSFIGPLLLGILNEAFQSQRAGISAVIILFLIGGVLLMFVDEERGFREAKASA